MKYLKAKLIEQRNLLYEILESKPNGRASAKMAQNLRIDDDVISKRGDITIIQNQSMHLVVNNISKALQLSDEILFDNAKPERISLDECLYDLLLNGHSWHEIKNNIKKRLFTMALDIEKNKAKAARRLGVTPRTFRYVEEKSVEVIDD
jgi:hypothetical protein